MENEIGTEDRELLRTLVPIDSLNKAGFDQLVRYVTVLEIGAGKGLFKRGDKDNQTVFLLSGKVGLVAPDREDMVEAGTDSARHALSNLKPRQYTATTLSPVAIAHVDSQLLDKLLAWDQVTRSRAADESYEVTEIENVADTDWTIQMLRLPIFLKLPSANLEVLFSRFQAMPVKAQQVIVKQGDPGDFYYIIKEGRCQVTRGFGRSTPPTVLAELEAGIGFGEEALLSDTQRNATVSMMEDGVLMRLSREDFMELMQEPLLNRVTDKQAAFMASQGAVLLDVRLQSEFQKGSVKGSTNLPLNLLRQKADQLPKDRAYVVFCDSGGRSAAAAFLLKQRGFDVCLLKGGLARLVRTASGS
ncbi:MAG: cyclic nucleotide-binding domain-containing protein [Gammaproteobacteria bacterium]|nr:cyclic nucleotide-binding domain-containing protein [Gammaproteobacteria bacterium]